MKITKGQLIIEVNETVEGFIASVNKKYVCGCTGFYRPTVAEAIKVALEYFRKCFW